LKLVNIFKPQTSYNLNYTKNRFQTSLGISSSMDRISALATQSFVYPEKLLIQIDVTFGLSTANSQSLVRFLTNDLPCTK